MKNGLSNLQRQLNESASSSQRAFANARKPVIETAESTKKTLESFERLLDDLAKERTARENGDRSTKRLALVAIAVAVATLIATIVVPLALQH